MATTVDMTELTELPPSRQGRSANVLPESKALAEGILAGKVLLVKGADMAKVVRQAKVLVEAKGRKIKTRTAEVGKDGKPVATAVCLKPAS